MSQKFTYKNRTKDNECSRKICYKTEPAAQSAYRQHMARLPDGYLHVYKCGFCTGWHLGHGKRYQIKSSYARTDKPMEAYL